MAAQLPEELVSGNGVTSISLGKARLELCEFIWRETHRVSPITREHVDLCALRERGFVQDNLARDDRAVSDSHDRMVLRVGRRARGAVQDVRDHAQATKSAFACALP